MAQEGRRPGVGPVSPPPPRGVGELLNETLAVYAHNIWTFLAIAVSVQLPVNVATLVAFQQMGGGLPFFVVSICLGVAGGAPLFSVGARGVALHLAGGKAGFVESYRVGLGRFANVVVLTAGMALSTALVALAAGFIVLEIAGRSWSGFIALFGAALLGAPVVTAVYVIWAGSVQSAIVEGRSAVGALTRVIALQGAQLPRLTMFTFVVMFVVFGLAVIVSTPFALATWLFDADPAQTGSALNVQWLGAVVVEAVVLPVLYIASALMYYDARVRMERFAIEDVSDELGLAGR